jgi:hypothetical protein
MESDNLLVIIAVAAVMFSVVGTFATYNSVSNYKDFVTGFATETGSVNITIVSSAAIEIISANNVDSKNLSWGSGSVTPGYEYARLYTDGRLYNTTTWTQLDKGFVIENIGNVNVTIQVDADKVAADFLGGTSPLFQYNVTDETAGSCVDWGSYTPGTYTDFTETPADVCDNFGFLAPDKLRMDIYLKVPENADKGTRNATVILTYEEIA